MVDRDTWCGHPFHTGRPCPEKIVVGTVKRNGKTVQVEKPCPCVEGRI